MSSKKFTKAKNGVQTTLPFTSISTPPLKHSPSKTSIGRGANGRFVQKYKTRDAEPTFSMSASHGPPKKRQRPGSPVPHVYSPSPSKHSYSGSQREPCALMVAATRNATAPSARKTHRHITAFGVRVPQELEEIRDYELPQSVVSPPEDYESDHDTYDDSRSVSNVILDSANWDDKSTDDVPPITSLYDS